MQIQLNNKVNSKLIVRLNVGLNEETHSRFLGRHLICCIFTAKLHFLQRTLQRY
jgi:hypothetical protein